MKCQYPNCQAQAALQPVIEIPTIRTVGIEVPVLSHLVHNEAVMRRAGLSPVMAVRQYEARLAEYKAQCNNMVESTDPTLLVGPPICYHHSAHYNFLDWFGVKDFERLTEAAREHGCMLDTAGEIPVRFETLEWTPSSIYMERQR